MPDNIKELTQNFTLIFTPSLSDPLLPDFKITAEELISNHLIFNYKNKAKATEDSLRIMEKKLTHTKNNSELFIEFLGKMRVESTEYVAISFKEPILYKSNSETEETQNIKYFVKQEYKILVVQGERENDKDRAQKENFEAARIGQVAVGTAASASIITAGLSGMQGSLFFLIRFLNIVEVVSNLALINVRFGSNLQLVIDFLDSFKMLEFGFLERISPLKDSKYEEKDFDAFRITPRGSRGKITKSNGQVFIMSGQNFIVSCAIIGLWGLSALLGLCLNKKNRIMRAISFAYQMLLGVFFVDYQMIGFAEIAFFDYSTHRKWAPKFFLSLILSFLIVILIGREVFMGFRLIKQYMTALNSQKNEKKKEEKLEAITPEEKLVIEKYTEVINLERYGPHWYFSLIDTLRFSVIQLVIVSLQLLNRTQALIVLFIDLVFFHYFVALACKHDIFRSNYLMDKTIIQECCILMFLVTITLFSFTENSEFSSSIAYRVIEVVAIISIVGTAAAELSIMLVEIYMQLSESCRKILTRKNSKPKKNILPKETERNSFRAQREAQNDALRETS